MAASRGRAEGRRGVSRSRGWTAEHGGRTTKGLTGETREDGYQREAAGLVAAALDEEKSGGDNRWGSGREPAERLAGRPGSKPAELIPAGSGQGGAAMWRRV